MPICVINPAINLHLPLTACAPNVGARVHYTLRMYYAAQQANEILNLAVSSLPANVSRIYASLVGTAVTYCIFAGIIMGLGVWKGWTDSDQDLQGEAHGREGGCAGGARGKGGNRVALVESNAHHSNVNTADGISNIILA